MNEARRKRLNQWLSAVENKVAALYGQTYVSALNLPEVKAAVNAGEEEFSWEGHKQAEAKLEKMLANLTKQLDALVGNGVKDAYEAGADGANDEVKSLLGKAKVNKAFMAQVCQQATAQRREDGLTGWNYLQQSRGGFTLSDRVWKITQQSKKELEIMVQDGIIEGKTAQEMSQDVRGCLNKPEMLFRRVKDKKTGELRLSKAARDYHPGQGVYRSSYKNAMRMARTEVNQAYRAGECDQYDANPLIKGYEIRLSNNHTTTNSKGKKVALKDICDKLAGIYPKDFKFTGWHPQCRCAMVPIPLTPDEFAAYMKNKKAGTLDKWRNPAIKKMPKGFTDWVEQNREAIEVAAENGRLPYFLKDNPRAWIYDPEARAEEIHQQNIERAEAKFVRNMTDAVSKYYTDAEKEELAKELGGIDDIGGKMDVLLRRKADIKSIIGTARDAVVKDTVMLNDDDVAMYKDRVEGAVSAKDLKELSALTDEIKRIERDVASWGETIDDPSGRVKTYGIEYTRAAVKQLSGMDKAVSKMELEDALGTLDLARRAAEPLYKAELDKRCKYIETSIKIRDLGPDTESVIKSAESSIFGSYKELSRKMKEAVAGRDVDAIEEIISRGRAFDITIKRFGELKKYASETKSKKFIEAITGAEEEIERGDIKAADGRMDRAQKEKDILESSKAYHKAKREAEKAAKEAAAKAAEIAKLESEKDLSKYIHKTLDEVRAEMGDDMPETLKLLDKSMEKYEKSRKYGADTKAHKQEIESAMAKLFEEHDLGMNIRSEVLEEVMKSWFKNTFETGTSGGHIGSSATTGKIELYHLRLIASHSMFMNGRRLEDQLERGEYEKYGNLLGHDIEKSLKGRNRARQYGEVEVRFKKGMVQHRTTWTAGDSLEETFMPSLVTDPKACSYDSMDLGELPTRGTKVDDMEWFRENKAWSYLELQFHGKLTIDCVESVAFRTDIRQSAQDKRTADLCASKGIIVYHIVNGKLVRYGDPKAIAKRLKEAADRRHAERDKELKRTGKSLDEAVKEAIDKRTKMHIDAMHEAKDAADEIKGMTSKDVSNDGYAKAMLKGDYMRAAAEARRIKEEYAKYKVREDALKDLIPDIAEQHRSFTIAELEAAHAAIKKKIEYIENKYPGDKEKQAKQLDFDIKWIEKPENQKYSTWRIARDAYKRQHEKIVYEIKGDEVRKGLSDLKAFKSRLSAVKSAINEVEMLISEGKYDLAANKLAEANNARMAALEKKASIVKPGETLQKLFDSDAYSKARKEAALWAKNENDPQEAFNKVDRIMSKYAEDLWRKLTDEEKHVAYLYTSGSRYINEPFFTSYVAEKRSLVDGSKRSSEKDINTLTGIIEKAKPLEHDMWVQHAEDFGAFASRFGVNLRSGNLDKLIGVEGVNEPFMSTSCAKNSFFTKEGLRDMPVVMSIYLPKGTKGMYCEPFSHYGDGRMYSPTDTTRYGADGAKWDGKSRLDAGIQAGDQVEYLLQRGAKLRITDVKFKDGRYFVECELIEQTARPKFTKR